jgi:hypothetical protein
VNSSPRRLYTLFAATFAVAVLVICTLRTRATYLEFYGDGPPYYDRTTNMDKWESPLLDLVVSNALGLALVALTAYSIRRRSRSNG